jgi:nitronate monooxygenase
MRGNGFLARLGIQLPIIQAPMGGGFTPPELIAAVANAGGLGSLAAGYLNPEQILEDVRRIRQLTHKPLNVNLFAGGYEPRPVPDARPMLALLAEIHASLGLPAPVLPSPAPDPFPVQFEAVMEARPEIFSFTFGIPSAESMRRLRENGIFTIGTATTAEEGRALAAAGVDAIVAQGAEAGAHRGTFIGEFDSSMVPTLDLTRAIRKAVALPVIASGGLMDGNDIAGAFEAGATAVQLGTAFLVCPEAGTPEAHKKAILATRTDTTVVTRAFSGRPSRGLRNAFIDKLDGKQDYILPFFLQNALTRPMRAAAAKQGNADFLSLWAGQGFARARALPTAELVKILAAEMKSAGLEI